MSLLRVCGLVFSGLLLITVPVFGQAEPLQQAIKDYEQENYEEALQVLETLLGDRESAALSYYLGVTYLRMGQAREAYTHLNQAHRLGMTGEALYTELAAAALSLARPEEALGWLDEAGDSGLASGELDLLRGMALTRQGRFARAHEAFDAAAERDPALRPRVDYLRAQVYVAKDDYAGARRALQNIIQTAPESDLAETAREFNRNYARQQEEYRPWGGRVQLGYLYDSNAIAEPEEPVPGLPDADDHAFCGWVRLEYLPHLEGAALFSARYDLNALL